MSFKVILVLFLCGNSMCSACPLHAPQDFTIGDDQFNWGALWNATKNDSAVSRSDDENIFDMIVRINAEARGGGSGKSDHDDDDDEDVFLFEGDIKMNKTEAIDIIQSNGKSRQTRAVKTTREKLWPQNVPYAIANSLSGVKVYIKNAIREWEITLPCLGIWRDVTDKSRPRDYMYFFRGVGCYSQIGRVGGGQRISIGKGCEHHGVIVHEIGHAMGLWHEQSRPDRDNYVTIVWSNIIPAMKFNFQKRSTSRINSYGVSYDYSSVMHYGAYAFSRYRGAQTIRSKTPGKRLGQRNGLSAKDKLQLQKLYSESCTKKPAMMRPKPTTRPQPPAGCRADLQSSKNCQFWKRRGYCTRKYVQYMKKSCCKTCGFFANCTDKDIRGYCLSWARSGYCSRNFHVKTHCRQSCGLCN